MSKWMAMMALAGLALGCAGAPARSTAKSPVPVDGTLTATAAGWLFEPVSGAGPTAPMAVPTDIAAVIQQIVDGQVTPSRATLEATPTDDGWALTGWRCIDCRPPAPDARWTIHGTEPFWGLVIRDDKARWSDSEAGIATPLTATRDAADRWTLTGPDGKPTISVRLEARTCDDGMADARWHYTAAVERDGLPLHGCAIGGR